MTLGGCHMQYVYMHGHRARLTFERSVGLLLPPEYHCRRYPLRQTSACTWRVSQPAYFHHCTAADMQERGLHCAQTSTVSIVNNTDEQSANTRLGIVPCAQTHQKKCLHCDQHHSCQRCSQALPQTAIPAQLTCR